MRTPSRYLFPSPSRELNRPHEIVFFLALTVAVVAGVGWLVIDYLRTGNPFIWLLALISVWLTVATRQDNLKTVAKRRIMADEREGLGICQFAREFAPGTVDSWVIRAVWNTLQDSVAQQLPLKADDKLEDDLNLACDEYELEELMEEIAIRCGHELTGIEDNPFLPIVTVRDLVLALNAQPMTAERQERLFISL